MSLRLNRIKSISTLGIGLLLGAVCFTQTALADASARLAAFARQTQTLSGQFSQVVYDRAGRKTQESTGDLLLARPGKFRWLYKKPYEQLIVGDGRKVWVHDMDLEQVSVRAMDTALGQSPAALLAGSNDIERYFTLREAGPRDGLDWIEATPKGKDGSFESVRLGFRGSALEVMELRDNFGQRTRLAFSGLKYNPAIAPESFRFKPPKGTDVIGEAK